MSSTNSSLSNGGRQGDVHSHIIFQIAFGVIAGTAFLSNSLLCYVILSNRHMLWWSYNVFIFSLAITDLLTGMDLRMCVDA